MPEQLVTPALIGASVTFITALVTRHHWPPLVRLLTALAITSFITAMVVTFQASNPDSWETWLASLGVAGGVNQATFALLNPTGLWDWLTGVTNLPTPSTPIIDADTAEPADMVENVPFVLARRAETPRRTLAGGPQ